MHRILDIHTHRTAPQFEAVVSTTPSGFNPVPMQYYSVGIHPWDTIEEVSEGAWHLLDTDAVRPEIVAIGECGIDLLKGGPLYRQIQVFKRQIDLSERLKKPLVIHCVHAHDVIIGIKKDLKPRQNWLIHGFRGKPTIAGMLLDAGMWLSFGDRFNDASVMLCPLDRMLAETDDAPVDIHEVITKLSNIRGEDLTKTIAENSAAFLTQIE